MGASQRGGGVIVILFSLIRDRTFIFKSKKFKNNKIIRGDPWGGQQIWFLYYLQRCDLHTWILILISRVRYYIYSKYLFFCINRINLNKQNNKISLETSAETINTSNLSKFLFSYVGKQICKQCESPYIDNHFNNFNFRLAK